MVPFIITLCVDTAAPDQTGKKKRLFLLPVNSKAEVRFHLASADWIPEAVRQKMASMVSTPQLAGAV